jgi:hypothetical protein
MRNIRQLCVAIVLTLFVAAHTFAGQIHTLSIDPPPPSTTDGQMETPVAGQMGTGNSEAVDPVTQVVLNIVSSVLSLF